MLQFSSPSSSCLTRKGSLDRGDINPCQHTLPKSPNPKTRNINYLTGYCQEELTSFMSDTISFVSIINIIFRESMRPEGDGYKTKTAATAATVTLQRYFTQKCHTSDVVSEKDYPRIHIAGKVMRVPSPNTKVMYFVSLHEPGKTQ